SARDDASMAEARRPAVARSEPAAHIERGIMANRSLASLACLWSVACAGHALAQAPRSGNPILPGWYADPEAHVFETEYWLYPTYSAPYDQQTFMDAFSSKDLVVWKKHPRVLDVA